MKRTKFGVAHRNVRLSYEELETIRDGVYCLAGGLHPDDAATQRMWELRDRIVWHMEAFTDE